MTHVLAALILSAPVPPPRPVPSPAGVYYVRNGHSVHRVCLRPGGDYVCEWAGVVSCGTWTTDGLGTDLVEDWCGRPFHWRIAGPRLYFKGDATDYKVIRVTLSDGRSCPR